jgi:hypothetical protein
MWSPELFGGSEWPVEISRHNRFRVALAPVSDKKPGGERSREDRLTDQIGLGVLTRLVHRDLVDEVLTDTGRTERRRRLLPAACAATTGTAGVVLGHQGTAAGSSRQAIIGNAVRVTRIIGRPAYPVLEERIRTDAAAAEVITRSGSPGSSAPLRPDDHRSDRRHARSGRQVDAASWRPGDRDLHPAGAVRAVPRHGPRTARTPLWDQIIGELNATFIEGRARSSDVLDSAG